MKAHLAAMRWLLVFLVVLLQVQSPALAQGAAPQLADCHGMAPASGPQHHAPDKAQPVAHLCPGCSIPGVAPLVAPQVEPLAAQPVPARFTALLSRSDPPSTPPPREA
ncbi:MAG: hypothetical protein WA842_12515 [Croceibacterium sp.]